MKKKTNSDPKILLADDHAITRLGLKIIISSLFSSQNIIESDSIYQTKLVLNHTQVDIIILNVYFMDGDAIEILQFIKEKNYSSKILLFSYLEDELKIYNLLSMGAHGFIGKASKESAIIEAIKTVMNGDISLTPKISTYILNYATDPFKLNPIKKLSPKEFKIAKLLVEGWGNLEISNHLNLKNNTISTFKARIFQKLRISNVIELKNLFDRLK